MNRVRLVSAILGLLFITAVVAVLVGHAWLSRDPEQLGSIVAERIEQRLGERVAISQAVLSFRRGPGVVLSDLKIGKPGFSHITVETLRVHLSIIHLFRGAVVIRSMVFYEPRATLCRTEAISLLVPTDQTGLPVLEVHDGTLTLKGEPIDIIIDSIEGNVKQNRVRFSASFMDGRVSADLATKRSIPEGSVRLDAIPLANIHPSLAGMSRAELILNSDEREGQGSLDFHVDGLKLSHWREPMESVTASCTVTISRERIVVDDLNLETPVLTASGSATIDDVGSSEDGFEGMLHAAIKTSAFNYERFVELLPVERFYDWLSHLLTEQIRDGSIQIASMEYRGPLADLASGSRFLEGLQVSGVLRGLSFGAGHDANRITDISGSAELDGYRLSFAHLSGRVGASRVDEVNLVFHDITLEDDSELSVGVTVDMELSDFVTAWRAAMVHSSLYGMLGPCSGASKGRIWGTATVFNDPLQPGPAQFSGDVQLTEGAFRWDGLPVRSVEVNVSKETFEAPLEIQAAGVVDAATVESLILTIPRPFEEEPYHCSAEIRDISLPGNSVRFSEGSRLSFQGTGVGGIVRGRVHFFSEGMVLQGREWTPDEGGIEGRGIMEVSAERRLSVGLEDVRITMAPGEMVLRGGPEKDGVRYELEGALDLSRIRGDFEEHLRLRKGTVAGRLAITVTDDEAHGNGIDVDGDIVVAGARVLYGARNIVIDGPIGIRGDTLSSLALGVRVDDARVTLSGALALTDPLHLSGVVDVHGLQITDDSSQAFSIPRNMTASVSLSMRDTRYHSISVASFRAAAELKDGVLRLENIDCRPASGTVRGRGIVEGAGPPQFDLDIDLEKDDLVLFMKARNADGVFLGQKVTLKGTLSGSVESLYGDVRLEARKGRIRKYTLISRIFTVTNLYRLVSGGMAGLARQGLPYERMSATIEIRDGTARFDDFYMGSPSIQMSAAGSYSIGEADIDAVAVIQPLETVDRVIGLVPLVNWLLLGEDKRFVVVSVSIRGAVDDPVVRVIPLETVSRPVTGVLLRTLRLPVDIILKPEIMVPDIPRQRK